MLIFDKLTVDVRTAPDFRQRVVQDISAEFDPRKTADQHLPGGIHIKTVIAVGAAVGDAPKVLWQCAEWRGLGKLNVRPLPRVIIVMSDLERLDELGRRQDQIPCTVSDAHGNKARNSHIFQTNTVKICNGVL